VCGLAGSLPNSFRQLQLFEAVEVRDGGHSLTGGIEHDGDLRQKGEQCITFALVVQRSSRRPVRIQLLEQT
jgi:hypothetical protein